MPSKLLIIDDEVKLRTLLARILEREGYEVKQAGDFKTATNFLSKEKIPVILCDVRLPDGNGVEMIPSILKLYPESLIILMTAYGNISDGVQAMKYGAYDYLTKGDDNDKILPLVESAMNESKLKASLNQSFKANTKLALNEITGKSIAIKNAIATGMKIAATDITVLLGGETGTGKEVFAQALHSDSKRKDHSFVALNCSTFSRDIMESELFGHVAGAFTGAIKEKKGLVAEADGGTLFLDEIGELPLDLQAKLLRVLESKEYLRVGDTKSKTSDFRLIAATNKDLKIEVEQGNFRQDLLFRLNILEIHLPPLRERMDDLEQLAQQLIGKLAPLYHKQNCSYDESYLNRLKTWHWPGNIRELRNVLERSIALSNDNILTEETLPLEMIATTIHPVKILSAFSLSSIEKLHIQKVLNYTKGNKAEAARLLEIGAATLYRKIEEYAL
ncbi:sigma-54-dependent transcriptional regulator [Rhizosphaericola mali]|uniref:Sigma-54-dependent Fis family transcriptional regulator n=1 Tax=Rhizosphaericola mali TaxID=2545455 RepID=A0A5P2GA06_9BACT|nr:sigma-54 dependent transcriptional regulator [Rhizosphaericola mali]QES88371.1 sigma-54-dependent Fis family transcriptional regulator [Rhizosphaericola mali]